MKIYLPLKYKLPTRFCGLHWLAFPVLFLGDLSHCQSFCHHLRDKDSETGMSDPYLRAGSDMSFAQCFQNYSLPYLFSPPHLVYVMEISILPLPESDTSVPMIHTVHKVQVLFTQISLPTHHCLQKKIRTPSSHSRSATASPCLTFLLESTPGTPCCLFLNQPMECPVLTHDVRSSWILFPASLPMEILLFLLNSHAISSKQPVKFPIFCSMVCSIYIMQIYIEVLSIC